MKKAKRLKQENMKRSRLLSKLFSSLFMSLGAVIIVVAFVPKTPVASIDELQVFKDTVTYQVSVIDEEHSILDDSLVVVLENQFTYETNSITSGTYLGLFENLSPDTLYTIKVMANLGFGLELLTKESFVTEEKTGGMIYENLLITPVDEFLSDYQISTYISDPYDEITNTYIKVSYLEVSLPSMPVTEDGVFQVNEGDQTSIYSGIYNENLIVTYTLLGTINNEEVVLDEYTFYTPIHLYGDFYPVRISSDSIELGIYGMQIDLFETAYYVKLYENDRLIKNIPYTIPEFSEQHMMEESSGLVINGLVNNHEYLAELWVHYKNPSTYQEEDLMLGHLSFVTPHLASYQVDISDHGDYVEVFIRGEDPYLVYQNAGYIIYEVVDGQYYYSDMSVSSLIVENDLATVTFVITKDPQAVQEFSVYVFNDELIEISIYLIDHEPL